MLLEELTFIDEHTVDSILFVFPHKELQNVGVIVDNHSLPLYTYSGSYNTHTVSVVYGRNKCHYVFASFLVVVGNLDEFDGLSCIHGAVSII